MKFEQPLIDGILLKRYKRFLADIRLTDGEELTVHCPNPGSMKTCSEPGRPVRISDSQNPKRKLRHTLEMIRMGRTWVGVNTGRTNAAVEGFIRRNRVPELSGYGEIRREVKYGREGRSRIDLLLNDSADGRPPCYVEVKNTTLREGDHAAFPDAVTERGRKHLEELIDVVEKGERGVMFFLVSRADCFRFRPADEIDPAYGEALRRALEAGVEVLPYRARYGKQGIHLVDRLTLDV